MATKDELRHRLGILAGQMINDRTQNDVNNILGLGRLAYDDMTSTQKTFISSAQKGAYNYQDRNRVSDFCNTLVTLMSDHYGTITPNYTTLPTNWQTIGDPTQAQLTTYINSIIAVRDKWYTELQIPGTRPSISQIYAGISLATANNIETVLKMINQSLNDRLFSIDTIYSGELYGPNANYVITSGGIILWMGVSRGS